MSQISTKIRFSYINFLIFLNKQTHTTKLSGGILLLYYY